MPDSQSLAEKAARLRGNYVALLLSLIAVIAIFPFLEDQPIAQGLLVVALLAVVATALLSCWRRTAVFATIAMLGLSNPVAVVVGTVTGGEAAWAVAHTLRFVFLAIVIGMIFSDVIRSRVVDLNTVSGAACVYLLMVLCFAALFSVVEWAQPGSFSLGAATESGSLTGISPGPVDTRLTYFSMITLTTIGYGDILPRSAQARALAGLEGVIGQLYLAIIIARLVGLEISNRMSRSS